MFVLFLFKARVGSSDEQTHEVLSMWRRCVVVAAAVAAFHLSVARHVHLSVVRHVEEACSSRSTHTHTHTLSLSLSRSLSLSHTHTHTHTHTFTHTLIRTHRHTHSHTLIRTHIHTHGLSLCIELADYVWLLYVWLLSE